MSGDEHSLLLRRCLYCVLIASAFQIALLVELAILVNALDKSAVEVPVTHA